MTEKVSKSGVIHDFSTNEFFIVFDQGVKAYIKYDIISDKKIHFLTTQVPPSLSGQGIAKKLVKEALEFCVTNNMYFKSSCWYINEYIVRNPSKNYNKYMQI